MTTSSKIISIDEKPAALGFLQSGIFSSVALGHLAVDLLNGTRPVLLTYLSVSLGLTNTALAGVSTAYVWVASASQPFFGWLADRIGARWLASLGILWMSLFFGLAMLIHGPLSLALLILGSLGSAAFHPAGTMESTLVGRELYAGRETTASALFFFAGQFGYFLGPITSGPLIDRYGTPGLLVLAAFLLPVGLNAGWQLRSHFAAHSRAGTHEAVPSLAKVSWKSIVLLAFIGGMQAWAQQNMMTFLPKYLHDLGQSPFVYGVLAGLFMGGSAFGNVLGGNLADKFGKQRVAMTALLLASLPLFAISQIGWSPWLYGLVPLSGALTGSVHSIIVVLAQRVLPMGMGAASGLTLGFIFSAGALGTLVCGPLADSVGWPPVFLLTGGLTLIAAVLTVWLSEG